MAGLRADHPEKVVELWAEDEARPGLEPIVRRAWAVKGRRPTADGRTRYRWLYVSGFVHPAGGRNLELILPAANTDGMAAALAEFARRADPDGSRRLGVLVDDAGWHLARRLAVPPDVILHRLPPRTPELQPVEPLWPLLREVVANQGYDDPEALERPVIGRRRWLIDHPGVVRGAVGFHWAVALNG